MNYFFELVVTFYFGDDVSAKCVQEVLSNQISRCMLYDDRLKELHEKNCYKDYVFCCSYPLETDKIYKKGRFYCFNIRTPNLYFAQNIKQFLPKVNDTIKVISVEQRHYERIQINEITNLTPIVCTVNNRCWMPENGLFLLGERLHINAVKKAKSLDNNFIEPEQVFFEHISLLNDKPIMINYKNTVLLSHKLRISVKPDEIYQKLAFVTLACGMAEKNAQGFGYSIFK